MAHFARIESGIVTEVLAVCNCAIGGCIGPDHPDYALSDHTSCGSLDFPETEPLGKALLATSGLDGEWVQCSYSAAFRGRYPGRGDLWDGAEFTSGHEEPASE